MHNVSAFARPRGAVFSHPAELINHAVLRIVADAWNRYPSGAPLPSNPNDWELLDEVLGLFAREGLVRMGDDMISLTEIGCDAVRQAYRRDRRLAEFLQGASVAVEQSGSSSLVLAILRALYEQQSAPTR